MASSTDTQRSLRKYIMKGTMWKVSVVVCALVGIAASHTQTVVYSFTQFPYKESVTNEKVWSEYEVACAQTPRCLELRGVHHTRCVRQCVSPSCYLDIYTHDELEEGEIDVRLPSFKGCFLQRMTRKLHTAPRP